jgi:hypothetical protein
LCLGGWLDSGKNPVVVTRSSITGPAGGGWYPAVVTHYDAGKPPPPTMPPPAPAPAGKQRPCDIYQATGTPCVAAHSVTRALFGSYAGPLYAVRRSSDNRTKDIAVLSAGGIADAAAQGAFCAGASCVISTIYDQSGRRNHLSTAPAGGNHHEDDLGVNASKLKVRVGGLDVFGAYFEGDRAGLGMGYRNDCTSGVATGDEPETIYMVTGGKHFNSGCCFDCTPALTVSPVDCASSVFQFNTAHACTVSCAHTSSACHRRQRGNQQRRRWSWHDGVHLFRYVECHSVWVVWRIRTRTVGDGRFREWSVGVRQATDGVPEEHPAHRCVRDRNGQRRLREPLVYQGRRWSGWAPEHNVRRRAAGWIPPDEKARRHPSR